MTTVMSSSCELSFVGNQTDLIDRLTELAANEHNKELTIDEKLKMIESMGGPHSILTVFLNYHTQIHSSTSVNELKVDIDDHLEQSPLNDTQMQSLVQIFDDHQGINQTFSLTSASKNISNENRKLHELTIKNIKMQEQLYSISMNKKNDFWHLLLGNNYSSIADKISVYATSNWIVIAFAIWVVFGILLSLANASNIIHICYDILMLGIIWICLLTLNVSLVRLMLGNFLMWFKIYHVLNFILFYTLYAIASKELKIAVFVVRWVIFAFILLCGSIFYCFADGMRWRSRIRIAVSMLGVIGALSVYFGVFLNWDPEIGFNILGLGFISFRSRMLSSLLILVFFFGKQAFSIIRNPRKAAVAKISPYILWS